MNFDKAKYIASFVHNDLTEKKTASSNLKLPRASNFERNIITDKWKPSDEAIEVLRMGSVNSNFIESKLAEFKIYWLERGQQRNNWNSTFIDYIRREWAKENNSNKNLPFIIIFLNSGSYLESCI